MKKSLGVILIGLFVLTAQAQPPGNSISLEYVYERVSATYPSAGKAEIQRRITDLNMRLAQTGWYPNISVNGSASYQSDVTSVPFAGPAAPSFSKDRYEFSVDISQPLFDGGRVRSQKAVEQDLGKTELAGVEQEMWRIRSQVDQVYFGILMLRKQREAANLLISDLEEQLSSVKAKVKNGVLLPGNQKVLQAELLKAEQQLIQAEEDIRAAYEVLSDLTGEEITPEQRLSLPDVSGYGSDGETRYERPEYQMIDASQTALDSRKDLIRASALPTVSAFAKTAYGRPGLDFFNDDLQFYWIVGIKAQWNFKSWFNSSDNEQVLHLQQRKLEADKDAFTRQLETQLSQVNARIRTLEQQIEKDHEVVSLRQEIVNEKKSLLNQGAITSTEYVTELNALNRAQLSLEMHQVQLVQAKTDFITKQGITWN